MLCIVSADSEAGHRGGERDVSTVTAKSRCHVSGHQEETSRRDADATGLSLGFLGRLF